MRVSLDSKVELDAGEAPRSVVTLVIVVGADLIVLHSTGLQPTASPQRSERICCGVGAGISRPPILQIKWPKERGRARPS